MIASSFSKNEFYMYMHISSTGARPRPLSASYQHRPSFSLPPGAGVEALFAATAAEGEEGSLAAAAVTRRTNLDLDQDVRRERGGSERDGGRERRLC